MLKNIRIKNRIYTAEANAFLNSNTIDTATVSQILKNGNVNIWDNLEEYRNLDKNMGDFTSDEMKSETNKNTL